MNAALRKERGAYLYYWRMEPGKQYRVYCRRAAKDDAVEELLVDENELAEGHTYCKVRTVAPSPDHNWYRLMRLISRAHGCGIFT